MILRIKRKMKRYQTKIYKGDKKDSNSSDEKQKK